MATSHLTWLVGAARSLGKHYLSGNISLKAGRLRWTGDLQPSEISVKYSVEVIYQPPRHPLVSVRHPTLVPNSDGELPHIYCDGTLCLYEPGQWNHGDGIAEMILPWTCEWLLHYEFWRATGVWYGSGGNHTGPVARSPLHGRG